MFESRVFGRRLLLPVAFVVVIAAACGKDGSSTGYAQYGGASNVGGAGRGGTGQAGLGGASAGDAGQAGLGGASAGDAGQAGFAGASAGDGGEAGQAGAAGGGSGSAGQAGLGGASGSGGVAGSSGSAGAAGTAGQPSAHHVHIYVDNFCNMNVDPVSITVPAGQSAFFDWHNHSVDYEVTVWKSYGGGYVDLATGDTWEEPIEHCGGPLPSTAYADISTACSDFRVNIYCE